MNKILLAGLALSVVFAGSSYAQETAALPEPTLTPEQSVNAMMRDMTTRDAGEKFTLIDENGDDEITREEYINFSMRVQADKKAKGELGEEPLYNEDFYSAMFDDVDVAGRGAVSRIEYINKQVSDILGEEIVAQSVEPASIETDETEQQNAIIQSQIEEQERIRAEEERVRKEEEEIRKAEQEAIEAEEEIMRMKEEMVANYDDEYEVVTRRRRR